MQLHQIGQGHKKAQRIGRGGKRGTTSGRGTKGQRSRSGHRIRPASRDLINRIPKLRGFRNKPRTEKPVVVDLNTLSRKLKTLAGKGMVIVDVSVLKQVGVVSPRYHGKVKILSDGAIGFPVTLKGLEVSRAAVEKITQAGGKIQ